jgi:hypothetical protein
MTRYVSVTVLVMVLLAGGRVASAQVTTPPAGLPDGETITFNELKIHEKNSQAPVFPISDPQSSWNYFNLAHCQCAAPGISHKSPYYEDTFQYLLKIATPSSMTDGSEVQIWTGTDCSNNLTQADDCTQLPGAGTVDTIKISMTTRPDISVFGLMAPTPKATHTVADCAVTGSAASTGTVWLLVNDDGGPPEYSTSQPIPIDKGPPPLPTGIGARGGEGAIELSWTAPTDTSDLDTYQALCALASNPATPGKTTGQPTPRYITAASLCEATDPMTAVTLTAVALAPPEDGVDAAAGFTPTGRLQTLDPMFLCGETRSPTATGLRIDGLENGVPYNVVLLAMDKFGNATGAYFTSAITPIPSTDFWEDLEGRHSKVDGGLCLLAETYGDDSALTGALRAFRDDTLGGSRAGRWLSHAYYATLGRLGSYVHGSIAARVVAAILLAPLVALALAWHWLSLPGLLGLLALVWLWRRRGVALLRRVLRSRAAPRIAAPLALVLSLVPGRAHAGGYQPYWENSNIPDEQTQVAADDPSLVTWLVGIRVGPYVPQIDKHFAAKPGPYAQMFVGTHIMAMLDVDRVLWTGYGQVAVGVSVGYMQNTARSFTMDSMASDPKRARATDDNKFALIPTALTATYRFTMLDDDYGIPIVPYARAGLSYYLWWVSDSNGFATVCKDGSDKATNPTCDKDRALGGSLGLQGSIGLSIRAERIDSSAAISMRQSGIQHAGIYGELSIAKVDGFGSETKLSVGDRTWFAGVDFEF